MTRDTRIKGRRAQLRSTWCLIATEKNDKITNKAQNTVQLRRNGRVRDIITAVDLNKLSHRMRT